MAKKTFFAQFLLVCFVSIVAALTPGRSQACELCEDFNYLCCDIPEDNLWVLTSFTGGESMACGGYADGT